MFDFYYSLQVIDKNLEEAIGAYFVYENIMKKATNDELFLNRLNENLYFWHYILYSLQTTYFMGLGRVFDKRKGTHSINAFLDKCKNNISLFSKSELKKRKEIIFKNIVELESYISNTYEPELKDFNHLKDIINECNEEYEKNYRNIRHLVFAHTKITKNEDLEKLFANTSKLKLEEIFLQLKCVIIGLFDLYNNGHKIELSVNMKPDYLSLLRTIKEESINVLKLL